MHSSSCDLLKFSSEKIGLYGVPGMHLRKKVVADSIINAGMGVWIIFG